MATARMPLTRPSPSMPTARPARPSSPGPCPGAVSQSRRAPALARALALTLALLGNLVVVRPALAGPEEIVRLEQAFAGAVAARGIQAGFLEFLSDDAILLRPRPVRGPEFLRSQPPDPGLLEWAPAYVRLSRSGDLAFTYGPWRYRASPTNTAVQATGQFVTAWKRTPAGWRAAFDAGLGSPAQSFPWQVEQDGPDDADDPLPSWQQQQRGRDLRFVEEAFGRRAAREGEAVALEAHGHRGVRLLRQGAFPVIGRAEAVRFLASNRRLTRDALQGFQVSAAGDLGYAWGESDLIGSGTEPSRPVRSWFRVWRRSGWSGTWRVALDLALDFPEATPNGPPAATPAPAPAPAAAGPASGS